MKKLKRFSTKAISVLLSILLVLLSLPLTVFAQNLNQADSDAQELIDKDIVELKELRTETTKTFRLEDGSYYVAQYDTAIHYLDADGVWQDIDNTLSASGSEISTSNARIKFAKKTTGNDTIFTLHDGNRKLTLAMDGAEKKIPGQITNHQTEFGEDATQLQKMTTLDKVAASVKYENILDGVDLEYVVNGRDIKENIIVKEKLDSYVYSFTMSLNNLTAVRSYKNRRSEVLELKFPKEKSKVPCFVGVS